MTTSGCCVQWCPLFAVFGVYISAKVYQEFHHFFAVVNTTLNQLNQSLDKMSLNNKGFTLQECKLKRRRSEGRKAIKFKITILIQNVFIEYMCMLNSFV